MANAALNLASLDGRNGFALNGIANGDLAGSSVSEAGDINGDGIDDLIIGADQAAPNGKDKVGQGYVVFGVRSGSSGNSGHGNIPTPGSSGNPVVGKTQKGSDRNDTFSGSNGDDNLTGEKGNDRLSGGSGNDSLSGGQGKDVLLGEWGADRLVGGQGADRLTGGTDGDTFVLLTLKDSLLSGVDRITDFAIGIDRMDGSRAIAAGPVVQLGSVRQLNVTSIAAVLTRRKFVANSAATFTKGSGRRQETFLVLNNRNAGFSATTDAMINITGYSGSLANLAIG